MYLLYGLERKTTGETKIQMKNCHICEGELYAVIDNREYCEECYKQWLKEFQDKFGT